VSPPDKIAGRYLAPYLSSQVGDAADVMPQHEQAIPVDAPLTDMALGAHGTFGELSDVSSR